VTAHLRHNHRHVTALILLQQRFVGTIYVTTEWHTLRCRLLVHINSYTCFLYQNWMVFQCRNKLTFTIQETGKSVLHNMVHKVIKMSAVYEANLKMWIMKYKLVKYPLKWVHTCNVYAFRNAATLQVIHTIRSYKLNFQPVPHGITISCKCYTRQFPVCYGSLNDVVFATSSSLVHLYTLRFKEKEKRSAVVAKATVHKQGSVQRFKFVGRPEFSVSQWVI
jgi:hypothetical protein